MRMWWSYPRHQESMGVAGATAAEAEHTIEGSMNAMKAAIDNLIVGFGNADADIEMLCNNVVDAFQDVLTNITPVIENIISALPTALNALLSTVGELLPALLDTVVDLFSQVLNTILTMLPELIPVVIEALNDHREHADRKSAAAYRCRHPDSDVFGTGYRRGTTYFDSNSGASGHYHCAESD